MLLCSFRYGISSYNNEVDGTDRNNCKGVADDEACDLPVMEMRGRGLLLCTEVGKKCGDCVIARSFCFLTMSCEASTGEHKMKFKVM